MSAVFRFSSVCACLSMALLIALILIGGCETTRHDKEMSSSSHESEFRTIGVVSVAVAPVFVSGPNTPVTEFGSDPEAPDTNWMAEHKRATTVIGGGAAGLATGAVTCTPTVWLVWAYPLCILLIGELGATAGAVADMIMPTPTLEKMPTTFTPVDTGSNWQRLLSEGVVSRGRAAGRTVFDLGLREEFEVPTVLGEDGTAVDAIIETRILAIKVKGIVLQDFDVSIQAESKLTRMHDQVELNKQTHQYQGPSVAFDPMDIRINNDRLFDQAIRAGLDELAVQIVAAQMGFDATTPKPR